MNHGAMGRPVEMGLGLMSPDEQTHVLGMWHCGTP
jgi:hypothetical protein